jgi:hypothetical protein
VEGSSLTTSLRYQDAVLAASYDTSETKTCTACGQRAPVLTGEEISLLEDAGAIVNMRTAPGMANVGLEASRLVLQRLQGAPVERVQVTCLVRLQLEPVDAADCAELATVPMTTLERELLLNLGALHAPGPADAATMQAIMQEAFDSSATVFELALLGPRASACYMDALAASMLGADDEPDA